jgi:RNA polymerase sigma-70 factor (ECF subfamily)
MIMDAQIPAITNCADDELVRRAQERDDSAFEELMRRTGPASLKLAVSILRDRQEAEDQVQNSYMNAWRHVSQFQREAKFSTWISRIVVNQCLMRLRKLRNANFVSLVTEGPDGETRVVELKDQGQSPEASLCGKELSQALKHEIEGLPPLLRGVLILRDVDQLSTAEVAAQLGLTAAAVKSRLLRARTELRTRLEKYRTRAELITRTA